MKTGDYLINKFKAGNLGNMTCLVNKPPIWNDKINSYEIKAYGRSIIPYLKSFQLMDAKNSKR